MSKFVVSYDLRAPGRDYAELYKAIKSAAWWAHPLESVWIVACDLTAEQVFDRLHGHIDKNDGLMVLRLADVGAGKWCGLAQNVSDAMATNL